MSFRFNGVGMGQILLVTRRAFIPEHIKISYLRKNSVESFNGFKREPSRLQKLIEAFENLLMNSSAERGAMYGSKFLIDIFFERTSG